MFFRHLFMVAGMRASVSENRSYRLLRLWPAWLLVACILIARFGTGSVDDGPATLWMIPAFGPFLCSFLILLLWLFASRATGRERLVGFFGMIVAIVMTVVLAHPTMRGPATTMLIVPMAVVGFVIGATIGNSWLSPRRTLLALLLGTIGASYSLTLRSEGMWGDDLSNEYAWRWKKTTEQQLVESTSSVLSTRKSSMDPALFAGLAQPEWPGFRGPDRSGIQRGTKLATTWETQPPKELWRINVGPAWSSFVVAGKLLFTQEQRGDQEAVLCYHGDTGEEVWKHSVEERFDEPLGGPGPRATPTLNEGALYVMGASGWLQRLDARSGNLTWKQDLRQVANRKPPMWGFASSPLIVNGLVIVYAGGEVDKGTVAFDCASGKLRWSAPAGNDSYASPHLCYLGGKSYVTMPTNLGFDLLDPTTGQVALAYDWSHKGYRSMQPIVVAGDSLVIPSGMGSGTRRIRITPNESGIDTRDLWTSRRLKPDFNDCVSFEGNLYGFDNSIFTCVSLEDGERKWKGGRYGKGQVLLLEDSRLLLVASERGDIVLLRADPASHQEVARFQVFDSKTWNPPVVIGDRLYHRNAEQAVCYQLPLAD